MNLPSWLTGGFRPAQGLDDLPLMQRPEWLGGGIDPSLLYEPKGESAPSTVARRPAPRKGQADRPRSPWSQMSWGERLSIMGAAVKDLDPNGGGNLDRLQAMQRREAEQATEAQRRRAMAEAYQASFVNGQFDPRAFAARMGQLGETPSISEAIAIENAMAPKPDPVRLGDVDGNGVPDAFRQSDLDAYYANGGQSPFARMSPGGQPQGLPPIPEGFRPVNPTEAPATVGAAPQGFKSYGEIERFLADFSPGSRVTDRGRTQARQDYYYERGISPTRNSTHVNGLGTDYVPNLPFSQWEAEAERLRATRRFRRVRVETGRGRGQGTGPHIHLEPY